MKTIAIALALAALAVAGPCIAAERAGGAAPAAAPAPAATVPDPGDLTDMQVLRKQVADEDSKRALVESVLKLTPAEAKKFWPIYDKYQRAVEMNDRKRSVALEGLIGRDRGLSDRYAKSLAKDLEEVESAESTARHTMYRRVMSALPPRKAARYIQLEQKVRATQMYDIAVAFPLVQ
jgi:Spy/CpxP family protein refolding chaperone